MDRPKIIEKHTRSARVIIGHRDLIGLARAEACKRCGITDSEAVEVEIMFDDETAGSPPYKVGTRVIVDVVEDQMRLPRCARADEGEAGQ